MQTALYPPGLLALARAHHELQSDRRLFICREELLAYIDRHKRRASAEPADDRYACTTWNGGAASSTRKVFKFLMRLFKTNEEGRFVNFRKRPVDADGFVRIFREEIQTAAGLGSTAVGQALRRLEELDIITRKHQRNEENGHRIAWFRLNPAAIYEALGFLRGFQVAREEVRDKRTAVDRTSESPEADIVDKVEDRPDQPQKRPQPAPFSSPEPVTDLRQVCSHFVSGDAGVDGQSGEPGAGVVKKVPATPGSGSGNKRVAPASPVGVLQPKEGTPAAQPAAQPARMSQQMIANAPRIQKLAEAARKAGMQLAPCGVEGGQPFLIPAGRQIIFPKLSAEARGFMFIPPPAHNATPARTYAHAAS